MSKAELKLAGPTIHAEPPTFFPNPRNHLPPARPKIRAAICHNPTRMNSILRIESSRANGAKSRGPVTPEGKLASAANTRHSTGPVTPEGKARSSLNAMTHGMLAGAVVLTDEELEHFNAELALLEDELQPRTPIEFNFVRIMAVASWRQTRLWCLEREQFEHEIRKQLDAPGGEDLPPVARAARAFRALSDESRSLELLNRYEARYDRQYQRALASFKAHRASAEIQNAERTEPNIG